MYSFERQMNWILSNRLRLSSDKTWKVQHFQKILALNPAIPSLGQKVDPFPGHRFSVWVHCIRAWTMRGRATFSTISRRWGQQTPMQIHSWRPFTSSPPLLLLRAPLSAVYRRPFSLLARPVSYADVRNEITKYRMTRISREWTLRKSGPQVLWRSKRCTKFL